MTALRLPSVAALDRELVRRRGFREFVRLAWSQVEPSPLVWSWHMDALCEHLEAVTRREIRDLVINVPPGMSKSLLTSVLWPAWVWALDPTHRWICASFSDKLMVRDARKARTLITGDWYAARWPGVRIPDDRTASTAATMYSTTAGGMRYSTTVRGQVTGQHADTVLVDDPVDPQGAAATSGTELDAVDEWWDGTMPTRFRDHRTSARVLIMQRVHERDLTRKFLARGAAVLCLPMRYEAHHPHRWARDPRTTEGELLCPARIPEEAALAMETILGPSRTAAQLQQRPSPAGGGIFREAWFQKFWTELPAGGVWTQSWDLTFKATEHGSYVVGQVWYQHGTNFYLVDQVRERLDFTGTCTAIKAMTLRYPKATKKLIEDKANGPAVVSALQREITGMVLVEPEGGKIARANASQALWAAGNVILPNPEGATYPDGSKRPCPWLVAFVHEHTTFPNGANDDQVDTASQYLNHAAPRYASKLEAAMNRVFPT